MGLGHYHLVRVVLSPALIPVIGTSATPLPASGLVGYFIEEYIGQHVFDNYQLSHEGRTQNGGGELLSRLDTQFKVLGGHSFRPTA